MLEMPICYYNTQSKSGCSTLWVLQADWLIIENNGKATCMLIYIACFHFEYPCWSVQGDACGAYHYKGG